VILEQVRQVAATDAPVLLLGETGTGKELLARTLRASGPRRDRRSSR
jgi:transcriptional regulator with GAF, ATPase, and Fis domain